MVEAEGLVKNFGSTVALDGLDLQAEAGTVLGMLGPNGAGKTTTVRILTTLLKPDAGRAVIDGIDVAREPRKIRPRIGLTGQFAAVDERLTGRENVEMVGRYYHLGGKVARRRAGELLDRFDLQDAADRVVKGYSGGMRRRLDIAMSLVAKPSILFLDEPTTGLDLRGRLVMWEVINELVRDGTTTLLTTQYLEEADQLANQIVVIDRGTVVASGTPQELKAKVGGERVEVTLADGAIAQPVVDVLARLATGEVQVETDAASTRVTVPIADPTGIVQRVVRALDEVGTDVTDVVVRRPTLDDVFLVLTGHAASQQELEEDAR